MMMIVIDDATMVKCHALDGQGSRRRMVEAKAKDGRGRRRTHGRWLVSIIDGHPLQDRLRVVTDQMKIE